jgi:hypothetical protein
LKRSKLGVDFTIAVFLLGEYGLIMSGLRPVLKKNFECNIWIVVGFISMAFLLHVPTGQDAFNFFDPPKRLLWSLFGLYLALGLVFKRKRVSAGKTEYWILGILVWMFVATLTRPVPYLEIRVLVVWILPFLLFFLGYTLKVKPEEMKILGWALLVNALAQAVLMLLQRLNLDPLFYSTTRLIDYAPGRMIGTIGYQNQAVDAVLVSMSGLFLVNAAIKWKFIFSGFIFLVFLLSAYRGGIVATCIAAAACGSFSACQFGKKQTLLILRAVGLAAVFLCVSVFFLQDIRTRFLEVVYDFDRSPAIQSRIFMAGIGLEMLQERPLRGWGGGEYAFQYLPRLGRKLPTDKSHKDLANIVYAREAHHDPIQFAAEFGLVGVFLVIGFLHSLYRGQARKDRDRVNEITGMIFIFVSMFILSLFSFPWQSAVAGPLAGFLAGVFSRPPSQTPSRSVQQILNSSFSARLTAVFVLLCFVGSSMFFARDAYVNQALAKAIAQNEPVAFRKRLFPFEHHYQSLLGSAFAVEGDLYTGLELLTSARRGFVDVMLWNNLGFVYSRLGMWENALQVYSEWAASGLDHQNALQNFSIAAENRGDPGTAADALFRRMRLWPQAVTAHDLNRVGALYLHSGDPESAKKALTDFARVRVNTQGRPRAELENLHGSVHMLLGNTDTAREAFMAALSFDPGLESARRNLRQLDD